jgi:predicted SnoaL-like aldol condensation-catalyzing enzyme
VKIFTPSRLVAIAALGLAALSFSVAFARPGLSGGGDHRDRAWSRPCPGKQQLERNKRAVVDYYTTAFNDKNPRLAVARHGGPKYIQHNPLAEDGFDAFIAFVEGFTGQFPDVHIDIRRVFADCNFVITHGLLTGAEPVFTERGSKVVDIFRLNRRGKIVEHWTSANGNPEV